MKHKKLIKDFGKFISVGFLWSGINVILMWLFVDIIGMTALISSTTSIIVILTGRFYSYVFIDLIHPHFLKFASTNAIFTLSNITLMTLSIDILKINTIIASILVVGSLFVTKFFIFNKIGLIKND